MEEKLKDIVSSVLNIDKGKINDDLARNSIPEWDSFNHLMLISEIEKRLEIKFSMQEVEQIKTFKDIRILVSTKVEKNE